MKQMIAACFKLQRWIKGSRPWLVLPVALSLLAGGSVIFVSRAHNQPLPTPANSTGRAAVKSAPNAAQSKSDPVQVVSFALYDVGILPLEVHVSTGLVAVTIEDLSGGSTGLVIELDNNGVHQPAGQVALSVQGRGRSELQFAAGRYEVSMADHPENRAVLIVDP